MTRLTPLPERAVLELTGADRVSYLQGLVSNDVTQAAPGRAVWTALLTPQGKYLADFFILAEDERLLLDCAAAQAEMLAQRLSRFRLRARVAIAPAPLLVHAAWDGTPDPPPGAFAAADPRLPEAGWRILAPQALPADATPVDWQRHRLALGLPEPGDLEPDKTVLLEAGFDELNGISWTKGCYMGQELTARTKYRGLLKRRLVPVHITGAAPASGTPVLADGAEIGTLRTALDDTGLAVLRLEALHRDLQCGDATLRAVIPTWMRLPEPAS